MLHVTRSAVFRCMLETNLVSLSLFPIDFNLIMADFLFGDQLL